MTDCGKNTPRTGPGLLDHAIGALNAWLGDYLSKTENGLRQSMAFYRENQPVQPEEIEASPTGKVCVLVHGLGCNESLWTFRRPHEGGDYGELLQKHCGYLPLYVRFNTGLRISDNGRRLSRLMEHFCTCHEADVTELLFVGHSMGGLVIRSACHVGTEADRGWLSRVRHVVYLGSPHLGAPLEKATNIATHAAGLVDTTATRVIRDLLNTRSAGVKDLRFGNLVDQDWLEYDPDELLKDRRVPIPWLATAQHHLVVGQALPGFGPVGDGMVGSASASGQNHGCLPRAPDAADVHVMPGVSHQALARNPAVFEHIERWVNQDG